MIGNLSSVEQTSWFDVFVDVFVAQCRDRAGREDDFMPFAALVSPETLRYFEGEDDEVPADFARRLHREAVSMEATGVFVAMVAPARAVYKEDPTPVPIDDDSVEAIQEAIVNGDLDLCVCWTANGIDEGNHRSRAGLMYLDDEGGIGQEIEAPVNPETDPFHGVLA
jgi:hypothetical protein